MTSRVTRFPRGVERLDLVLSEASIASDWVEDG